MLIKICGLRREKDIEYANELKPDFIGFILAHNKKRTISIEMASKLYSMLDHTIKAVGVFLDNDIEDIKKAVELKAIDYIQLHGDCSDEYIKKIKSFTDLPIIKAYRDSDYADYTLLDNVNPGSGKAWSYTVKSKHPVFLAGGISIENIEDVLKLNPYCIDVSSSLEVDGYKDYLKMKEIIMRCRDYE